MSNYENEIMAMLKGDTPKQKYESLINMIDLINTFKDDNSNNIEHIKVPKFFIDSWKKEEQIWIEELGALKSKINQATTFLRGLKDTPDSTTIGNIRIFIDANYENITK